MQRDRFLRTLLLALLLSAVTAAADPSTSDTRLLTQPAISATHVAFVYADDLWIARIDGTDVRRLTTDDGVESNPAFSPDGKAIAFSAQYDGNVDVYLVPVEGGVPKRLTWHPGADVVQGFTPDGSRVLFTSGRAAFTGAHSQLYTVPVAGGLEERLPIPNAFQAAYSPDGQAHRVQPAAAGVPAVEAVPRRPRVAHLDLRHRGPRDRQGAPAGHALQRRGPDVGGRDAVSPLRP